MKVVTNYYVVERTTIGKEGYLNHMGSPKSLDKARLFKSQKEAYDYIYGNTSLFDPVTQKWNANFLENIIREVSVTVEII